MFEKENRTTALATLLSMKEKKVFARILNYGKRTSLARLFQAICGNIEKELLFKKTFGSSYSKEKDYLLRNELRLLSKELTLFLALEQTKKNFRDNPLEEKRQLLRSFINRKATALFNRQWSKVVADATEQLQFNIALDVLKMAIDHSIQHQQATVDNYNKLLKILAQYQNTLKRYFLHQHLFGKHKQAFTQRTLQALGSNQHISPIETITIDPTQSECSDAFSDHFVALTQSYAHRGNEKIELLKNAASFVAQINTKQFDRKAALASINAGIALEYFLLREFETSLPFHKNALEFGAKLDVGKRISFVFNYLSTHIRMDNYKQAILLITEYEDVWQRLPRMRDRFLCLKAMCHIFENDPKAAESCIPNDRKASGIDHYYYYRFIQIIVLYQKGKEDLAMNEVENFEHTVRYNDKNANYLLLIQAMKKFLALRSEVSVISEKVYAQRALKLKRSLKQTSDNAFAGWALFYKWVVKELG